MMTQVKRELFLFNLLNYKASVLHLGNVLVKGVEKFKS